MFFYSILNMYELFKKVLKIWSSVKLILLTVFFLHLSSIYAKYTQFKYLQWYYLSHILILFILYLYISVFVNNSISIFVNVAQEWKSDLKSTEWTDLFSAFLDLNKCKASDISDKDWSCCLFYAVMTAQIIICVILLVEVCYCDI